MAKLIGWVITVKRDFRSLAKLYQGRISVFSWGFPNILCPFFDFNPCGLPARLYCAAKAAVLAECSKVLYGTQSFAEAALHHLLLMNGIYTGENNFPTWPELLDHLNSLNIKYGREAEYLIALRTRVGAMVGALGPSLNYRIGLDLRDTMSRMTVFELSPMLSVEIVRYITHSLAYWQLLYRSNLPFSEIAKLPHCILIIDDASQLVDASLERDGNFGVMHRVATLGREFGLSVCASSQLPEKTASCLFDLHGTTISFRLPAEASRRKVGEVL